MYDDDQREKEAARNQLIVFVTMAVMLMTYFYYFVPQRPTQTPGQVVETVAVEQQNAMSRGVALESAATPEVPVAEGAPSATTPATAAPATGWPYLPPVPTDTDPAADEVTIKKDDMELVFTRIGGRLKRASLMFGEHGEDRIQLIPESTLPDTQSVYPFGLRFSSEALRDEIDRRRFEIESRSETEVVFALTLPNAAVIRKRFAFTEAPHVINATVEYKNAEGETRILGRDQDPAFVFTWGPNINSQDLLKGIQQALVWRTGSENQILGTANMEPEEDALVFTKRMLDIEWLAIRSAYFIVAMKPAEGTGLGIALGNPQEFRFGLAVPRTEISPGDTLVRSFDIYIGPSHLGNLKKAWPTLDTGLQFFEYPALLDWFAKLLLQILNWCYYNVYANYGIAIILLTVAVRLVMFPLTLKQMKTMKRMQMLAPEMEKLKAQYGNDPQEMQRKMMEMYKEYGMNPAAGCLPMVLQLPVFIALYRMLWSAYELRGAPFFGWIIDLSEPDRLFHIPALGQLPWIFHHLEYVNVLPLLSALAMVISVKFTPMSTPMQNQQQKILMTVMPVIFCLFCYSLASGLNLYILISTLLGIAQSWVLHFQDVAKPEKVVPKKRQHFYDAAVQKKKQVEREQKERKRKERKYADDDAQ
ncbi:MAG TPA: membrane protein insertase YidC [Candidatus Hydrogenedentes bacterium]|mgnify:CR=1 FL=1|nr:membrane protein insertase YidC [Candidatus Hydrogenedentota bacterium]